MQTSATPSAEVLAYAQSFLGQVCKLRALIKQNNSPREKFAGAFVAAAEAAYPAQLRQG